MPFVIRAIAGISLAALASVASAQTTYTYVGNPFVSANGGCTTSDHLEVVFTLAAPVPPNSPREARIPTTYSFEACGDVCTNESPCPGPGATLIEFGTDASGTPSDWLLRVEWDFFEKVMMSDWRDPATTCLGGSDPVCSGDLRLNFGSPAVFGENRQAAGSWTIEGRPVPAVSGFARTCLLATVAVIGAWALRRPLRP